MTSRYRKDIRLRLLMRHRANPPRPYYCTWLTGDEILATYGEPYRDFNSELLDKLLAMVPQLKLEEGLVEIRYSRNDDSLKVPVRLTIT